MQTAVFHARRQRLQAMKAAGPGGPLLADLCLSPCGLRSPDVIASGVFISVPDLKRKLMRYSRLYNKQPKPVMWKYFDSSRRIASTSTVTVH
jgi:hypothetical protein